MSKIQDLPDELVLKILRNSETKDLISCGQVSRRIRKIAYALDRLSLKQLTLNWLTLKQLPSKKATFETANL